MFSHVFTSVSDFPRAFGFYDALMRVLDLELRFHEPDKPWAGWPTAPTSAIPRATSHAWPAICLRAIEALRRIAVV